MELVFAFERRVPRRRLLEEVRPKGRTSSASRTSTGVHTNLDYLALVLSHPPLAAGDIDVEFVERHPADAGPVPGSVSHTEAAGTSA